MTKHDLAIGCGALVLWMFWQPAFAAPIAWFGVCIGMLVVALSSPKAHPSMPIVVLLVLIPPEFSVHRPPFHSLSPVDFYVLALLLSFLGSSARASLMSSILAASTYFTRVACIVFFSYALALAIGTHGSLQPLFRWGEFLFIYIYAFHRIRNHPATSFQIVGITVLVLGVIVSGYALWQFVNSSNSYVQVKGPFGHNNILAAFLSLCLPCSLAVSRRVLLPWRYVVLTFFLVIAIVFLLTLSRGAFLAFGAAGIVVALILSRRDMTRTYFYWMLGALVGVVLAAGLFQDSTPVNQKDWLNSNGRLVYLGVGLRMVSANPWLGVGPGHFHNQLPQFISPSELAIHNQQISHFGRPVFWQHLHNFYLHTAVEYGLIGLTLVLAILLSLFLPIRIKHAKYWSPFLLVSVLAFFIHNTVDILFVHSLDMLLAVYAAFLRDRDNLLGNARP